MKEDQKRLQVLAEKIESTQKLLKIGDLKAELLELENIMQKPDFWSDADKAKAVGKRQEALRNEAATWTKLKDEVSGLIDLSAEIASEDDQKAKAEIEAEINKRAGELERQFSELEFFLLFDGKHDQSNAIVSIHAGSGGTEAQDWSAMLLRMILRFAEKKGWSASIIDESKGAEAGIKSATVRVEGRYAFGHLKSEHGTHRLVRISPFDAEKMRHTSFAGIEVIPELESADVVIDPKDLRVDTFMAGGHGGQSVNTTYSAVRVVHIPTGLMVQCQNERSQMQNKDVAMRILRSRLQQMQEEKEAQERNELRGEYKSAEWGNQIRSYVLHPYKLVKDVRTKFETTDPDSALNGGLEPFVEAYLRWLKQKES